MAIEFEGGVVIGADSRTTTGYVYVDHIMSHCATDLDSKRLNYSRHVLVIYWALIYEKDKILTITTVV
jgi:hypothetical protein